MSDLVRSCVTCGAAFPVPANNPHRRYCTPRCRVADWRCRHLGPDADVAGTAAPDASADSGGEPPQERPASTSVATYAATGAPYDANAVRRNGADGDATIAAAAARCDGSAVVLDDLSPHDDGTVTARCPHCARPVAVTALLVPPAAAHVRAPEVPHG